MKAIIVEFSLKERLLVPDDFDVDNISDENYKELKKRAIPKIQKNINTGSIGNMLSSVTEDMECPIGRLELDTYYQPDFEDLDKKGIYDLSSWDVFKSKSIAQKAFPDVKILTYHQDDIENVRFVDIHFD